MNPFEEFKVVCKKVADAKPLILVQTRPIWIFGTGSFGRQLCNIFLQQGFQVVGFIETEPKQKKILNLPVFAWPELAETDKQAQLVIGIFNRDSPLDDLYFLGRDAGFSDIFMPWHVYLQFEENLGWRYWLSTPKVILDALPEIESTLQLLEDEESRKCLLDILTFRLGQNNGYGSFTHEDNQYFNELTLPSLRGKASSYIDCGAYNGDTYNEISDLVELSESWLFEPDPKNYKLLVSRAKAIQKNVMCLPCAVSDGHKFLAFSAGGESGAITEKGSLEIMTIALDDLLPTQHIGMIKLDVEGAEISALQGARDLIKRSRPVIALSLYHRPKDPWEITTLIRSICPDYRFYIRQHYFNSFDSVLYAVPKNQ